METEKTNEAATKTEPCSGPELACSEMGRRRTPGQVWTLICEMVEHTASVEALSDIQLCECIREEITDQMPMHSRDFALIDEAVERLSKRVAAGAPPTARITD